MYPPLLGVRAGLDPNSLIEVKHIPGRIENFAAACAGQHQKLDRVGRCNFLLLVERSSERHDVRLVEVSLALFFGVALDSLGGVVLPPMPADREIERPSKDLNGAIGPDGGFSNARDVPVQFIEIIVLDVCNAGFGEARQDDLLPHRRLVELGAFGLLRQFLGFVALPQVLHGRGFAQRLPLTHGVVTLINLPLHRFGGGAGGLDRPVRIVAERDAPLTTIDAIVENERLRAAGGDTQRETLDLGIP